MKYIRKDEVESLIQKYIDARKDKNCSKQSIIERKAFEYTLAIVQKVKVYDFDE